MNLWDDNDIIILYFYHPTYSSISCRAPGVAKGNIRLQVFHVPSAAWRRYPDSWWNASRAPSRSRQPPCRRWFAAGSRRWGSGLSRSSSDRDPCRFSEDPPPRGPRRIRRRHRLQRRLLLAWPSHAATSCESLRALNGAELNVFIHFSSSILRWEILFVLLIGKTTSIKYLRLFFLDKKAIIYTLSTIIIN